MNKFSFIMDGILIMYSEYLFMWNAYLSSVGPVTPILTCFLCS